MVGYYPQFINGCINDNSTEFHSIEKFPSTEVIRSYLQYGNPNICDDILLYEYGWFDIKELVAIIKVLYSLKRQKEYKLVTIAGFEDVCYGPEDIDKRRVPYINYLVGLDKKVISLEKYNGTYLDDCSINDGILSEFDKERHLNLVRIKHEGTLIDFCYEKGYLSNYFEFYDDEYKRDRCACFRSRYNIFNKYFGNVIRKLDEEVRSNIGGLFSFSIDFQDNFIAKILMSIVIYKKKINKKNLDNDDYKYIFYELFREDVDIDNIIKREIPKCLVKAK